MQYSIDYTVLHIQYSLYCIVSNYTEKSFDRSLQMVDTFFNIRK